MGQSKIEWTERTWNPITGCSKISEGCAHCYAERMAHRLAHIPGSGYGNGEDTPMAQVSVQECLHELQGGQIDVKRNRGGLYQEHE